MSKKMPCSQRLCGCGEKLGHEDVCDFELEELAAKDAEDEYEDLIVDFESEDFDLS